MNRPARSPLRAMVLVAGLALAALLLVALAQRVAGLTIALADAAALLVAEAEARDVDLRDGDRDEVLAFAPDQLALRDVLAEVLADPPADYLSKAAVILVDL